jgi:pyridoxal phosphate enzyme (YggS family)
VSAGTSQDRLAELAANLGEVRTRIVAAAGVAGRDPAELTLIAVTKTWPATDVAALRELGVRDFAENREAETAAKVERCAEMGLTDLRWHFVGQVQTNKARSVAGHVDVVHSLDRLGLVEALEQASRRHGRILEVLVQLDLDPRGDGRARGTVGPRGGAARMEIPGLCTAITAAAGLRLRGVMGVAPIGVDPSVAFAELARSSSAVREIQSDAGWISAGMSTDLEAAIAHGATHLRVGSGLLGRRAPTR